MDQETSKLLNERDPQAFTRIMGAMRSIEEEVTNPPQRLASLRQHIDSLQNLSRKLRDKGMESEAKLLDSAASMYSVDVFRINVGLGRVDARTVFLFGGTNRRQEHSDLRGLVLRAFAIALVAGGVGTALIAVWGSLTAGLGFRLGVLAACSLVPNVIWQTISGVLLGVGRIRLWNVIQLLSPVLTLIGMIAFVVVGHLGVGGAIGAWVAANVLTALFALVTTRDLWLPPDVPPIDDALSRAIARIALVMGAVQVVNLVSYRAELFILGHYRGATGVGVYSIAMQSVESIWLIAGAMATSVTADAMRDDDGHAARLVAKTAGKGLLYTAIAAAPVAAAAPFVIPFIFGDAFKKAALPLALLMPGAVIYAPVSILVVYLSVRRGRPGLSLAVSVVAMVLTAAFAIALVPWLGGSGAAVASSAGYAGGAVLSWLFFARLARIPVGDLKLAA